MDGMKWVGNVWYGKRDCYNSENTQFTLPFGAPRTLAYILCFILFNRKNSVGRILFLLFFSFHLAHTFRARRVRCIRLICCLCFAGSVQRIHVTLCVRLRMHTNELTMEMPIFNDKCPIRLKYNHVGPIA